METLIFFMLFGSMCLLFLIITTKFIEFLWPDLKKTPWEEIEEESKCEEN